VGEGPRCAISSFEFPPLSATLSLTTVLCLRAANPRKC